MATTHQDPAARLGPPRAAFDGAVQAVFADIGPPSPDARTEAWLAPLEIKRADQFRFRALRDRFVHRRAILRLVLAQATGTAPDTLQFQADPAGRPFLPGGPDFNSSSSNDVALIAVARDASRVGADVELSVAHSDLDRIAASVFTAREQAWMAAAANPQTAFYQLWTGKEAYLKATGDGLALEPRRAEIDLSRRRAAAPKRPDARLQQLAAPDGYAAALALLDPERCAATPSSAASLNTGQSDG